MGDTYRSFFRGHPRSGWFLLAFLLLLTCFVWLSATPTYVRYFLADTPTGPVSGYEVPGDGTVPGRRVGEMALVFFDVEYGDGILVQGPRGTTSLIDGGEGKYPESPEAYARDFGYRLYLPFFREVGTMTLRNFISTVPFSHHMGAQPDLLALKDLRVRNIYWTGYPARFGAHRRFRVHARREGNFDVLEKGESVHFGEGIESRVVYARNDVKIKQRTSRVILLKYGSKKFLLMSDLPRRDEAEMVLEWGDSLNSDLIKLGSHGADDSNSRELLRFVKPDYAVISVSPKNPLGAPQKSVLGTLRQENVGTVYRTSQDGHIAVYTDGESIRINTRAFPFL